MFILVNMNTSKLTFFFNFIWLMFFRLFQKYFYLFFIKMLSYEAALPFPSLSQYIFLDARTTLTRSLFFAFRA